MRNYKKVVRSFYFVPLIFIVFSCSTKQNIYGTYESNFADLGFFITKIELKKDSTFNYNFAGDLINQSLTGKYYTRKNTLYLEFKTNKGEIETEKDSLTFLEALYGNQHNYELKKENDIEYHRKFKISNGKLFSYRIDNGKLVTAAKYYDGKAWLKRKSYLEKIN
jgi:hypothetical protein